MKIDRRSFIAGLGGVAAVSAMSSEAKADALEHYMEDRLDAEVALQQGGAAPANFRRSKRRSRPATTGVERATCSRPTARE